MNEQNKKSACYIGKDNKHLITVNCTNGKMTVAVHSIDGIKFYCLDLI